MQSKREPLPSVRMPVEQPKRVFTRASSRKSRELSHMPWSMSGVTGETWLTKSMAAKAAPSSSSARVSGMAEGRRLRSITMHTLRSRLKRLPTTKGKAGLLERDQHARGFQRRWRAGIFDGFALDLRWVERPYA